jgi:hypothetical protein
MGGAVGADNSEATVLRADEEVVVVPVVVGCLNIITPRQQQTAVVRSKSVSKLNLIRTRCFFNS